MRKTGKTRTKVRQATLILASKEKVYFFDKENSLRRKSIHTQNLLGESKIKTTGMFL